MILKNKYFEKVTDFARNSLKNLSFPEISSIQNPSEIPKNHSQGMIFVKASCQRQSFLIPSRPLCLAHRHRSDFCDLRLRCPSGTPEIASDFRDLALRFKGAMEVVASDLQFRVAISEPETPSAGFLASWLRQRGNR